MFYIQSNKQMCIFEGPRHPVSIYVIDSLHLNIGDVPHWEKVLSRDGARIYETYPAFFAARNDGCSGDVASCFYCFAWQHLAGIPVRNGRKERGV